MRKRFRIWLALLPVAALAGLAWLLLGPREPDPLYRGRPLTYWLQGFSPGQWPATKGPARPSEDEAQEAVQHFGTNAIPTLLRLLRTPDSPFRRRAFELIERQHFVRISHIPPMQLYMEIVRGFGELGAEARPAVAQLCQIYDQHSSEVSRQIIPQLMADIGPSARDTIPLLVRGTTDPDPYVRNNSLYALRRIGGEPALVVPALIKCLTDPIDYVRAKAADALAAFGTNAQPAVPELLKLLAREPANPSVVGSAYSETFTTAWGLHPTGAGRPRVGSLEVSGAVTAALKAIDPETAAKAGVK